MPVDATHEEYKAWKSTWEMLEDCYGGELAVKNKGTAYLPRLTAMDDQDYQSYKMAAEFYPAFSRTVQGLLGSIFRVSPVVEVVEAMKDWLDDISLSGISLQAMLKKDIEQKLITGRYGLIVDKETGETDGRLYVRAYEAEDIVNWKQAKKKGAMITTLVVLREDRYRQGKDEFEQEEEDIYRVLDLDELGLYRVRIFVYNADTQAWYVESVELPTMRGQRLDFLPFVFDGITDINPECEKPPLLDLATTCLGHYRLTADYYDAILFTSKPQPWVAGGGQQKSLRIGSRSAWLLPQGATAGYLEYSGAGISDIRQALTDKEGRMARLGAAVLQDPKNGVESAETARINESGKVSVLANIVSTTDQAWTRTLQTMAWWGGLTKEQNDPAIVVKINMEFIESQLSPADLYSLVQSWQAHGISQETLLWNIKRGGRLPEDRTTEDEIALIEEDQQNVMKRMQNLPNDLQASTQGQ